jgi:hypothetical protein
MGDAAMPAFSHLNAGTPSSLGSSPYPARISR